ncbi:type I toxin-antitoxin system Fst family toxin [Lactobacillus gigeriorum]|nr:type I toxin-antitoxin system Fst family toxin [Lactobacillus gigeriorum]
MIFFTLIVAPLIVELVIRLFDYWWNNRHNGRN